MRIQKEAMVLVKTETPEAYTAFTLEDKPLQGQTGDFPYSQGKLPS